jgi:hypothetical protein
MQPAWHLSSSNTHNPLAEHDAAGPAAGLRASAPQGQGPEPHLSSDSTHSSRMMQSSSQQVLAWRAAATCSGLAPSSWRLPAAA